MPDGGLRDARRLLVVRTGGVREIVALSPALRALRATLPGAELTLLTSEQGAVVTPLLPWIDKLVVQRLDWRQTAASSHQSARGWSLVESLRARAFDAAMIFTSHQESPFPAATLCYLAGIPIRVGQSRESGEVLTIRVQPSCEETHQVDRDLLLLGAAGIPAAGRELELRLPGETRSSADLALGCASITPGSPFVAVALTTCPARQYSPRALAEVARRLFDEAGVPTVLIGDSREESLAREVLTKARKAAVSLVGRISPLEQAAIVGRCALLVTTDHGPIHLADAFARPMLLMAMDTAFERQWCPRVAPTRIFLHASACAPFCETQPAALSVDEPLEIPPDELAFEALALMKRAVTCPAALPAVSPRTARLRAPTTAPRQAVAAS